SLSLGDDVVAKGHTLVADEDARPGNQFSHLAAPFSAEGAMEVIHHQSLLHRRGALANSMSRRGPRRARGPTEGGASEEFVSSPAPRTSPAERLPSTSLESPRSNAHRARRRARVTRYPARAFSGLNFSPNAGGCGDR